MNSYTYEAVNSAGLRVVGALDVADQSEALRRLREMGLFPTRVVGQRSRRRTVLGSRPLARSAAITIRIPGLSCRVKPRALTVFTRPRR